MLPQYPLGAWRFQGDVPLQGYLPWIQQCRDLIYPWIPQAAWDEKITAEIGQQAILDLAELTKHGFTEGCPVELHMWKQELFGAPVPVELEEAVDDVRSACGHYIHHQLSINHSCITILISEPSIHHS